MLEALCRQSSTTLDIVHAEDGPPITQRTSGLGLAARLTFFTVSLPQFYAWATAVLVDEFDAGRFESSPDGVER